MHTTPQETTQGLAPILPSSVLMIGVAGLVTSVAIAIYCQVSAQEATPDAPHKDSIKNIQSLKPQ